MGTDNKLHSTTYQYVVMANTSIDQVSTPLTPSGTWLAMLHGRLGSAIRGMICQILALDTGLLWAGIITGHSPGLFSIEPCGLLVPFDCGRNHANARGQVCWLRTHGGRGCPPSMDQQAVYEKHCAKQSVYKGPNRHWLSLHMDGSTPYLVCDGIHVRSNIPGSCPPACGGANHSTP